MRNGEGAVWIEGWDGSGGIEIRRCRRVVEVDDTIRRSGRGGRERNEFRWLCARESIPFISGTRERGECMIASELASEVG